MVWSQRYVYVKKYIYIHLLDETKNEWFEREKLSGGQTDF